MKQWCVYIVRCKDNSLYTGCTDNLNNRISKHNTGKGAKYTRSRLPVDLVYLEICEDYSQALKRESAIKSLSRKQKIALASNYFPKKIPI